MTAHGGQEVRLFGDGLMTVFASAADAVRAAVAMPLSGCQSLDTNGDRSITVDEIIAAVNEALNGCG